MPDFSGSIAFQNQLVYDPPDHDRHTAKVKPEHQYNYAGQTSIQLSYLADVFHIEGESEREQNPADGCKDSPRQNSKETAFSVGRQIIQQREHNKKECK